MRFDLITIFPKIVRSYFDEGIIRQGIKKKLIEIQPWFLRDFVEGNYKQVDDRVYGGGAGMLQMFEPTAKAIEAIKADYAEKGITKFQVLATSAKGNLLKQSTCNTFASDNEALIILCGRYEGFDQRIIEELVDQEISLGNFVLSGGELAAMAIVDATARLIPGVLGKQESFEHDSFYKDDETLQYPQYTRPEVINYHGKELKVPEVLLSGNHAEVAKWRKEQETKRLPNAPFPENPFLQGSNFRKP